MNRRFVLVTLLLTATAAFLVGLIVAGSLTPNTAQSAGGGNAPLRRAAARPTILPAGGVNFADIAERINPAVVNIDAAAQRRARAPVVNPPATRPGLLDDPSDHRRWRRSGRASCRSRW